MPILESQTFQGQEYLDLYPYLEYAMYSDKNRYEFWVNNQGSDEYTILRSWLIGLMEMNRINIRRCDIGEQD